MRGEDHTGTKMAYKWMGRLTDVFEGHAGLLGYCSGSGATGPRSDGLCPVQPTGGRLSPAIRSCQPLRQWVTGGVCG